MNPLQRGWILAGLLVAGAAVYADGQVDRQTPPQILIESLAGRDSFDAYCASCHGSGGQGDGPVVAVLQSRPADLTTLARRSAGAFPREQVRAVVIGTARPLPAHGTSEMPVWGPLFRTFESDVRVRERVENLLTYIESLQVPTSGPEDPGAVLFRTHCASCHGRDGRGTGPLADQLRRPPPDLTQFTARNGGVFPSERVARIIEGGDVPSHGSREMPVWGDAFRALPGGHTEASVKARIDAITRYLQAIQQRMARL